MQIESANPNATGRNGAPVIFDVIETRDLAALESLVEAGADIHRPAYGGETPALHAAQTSNWRMCLFLLNRGANPLVTDNVGLTIAYLAGKARVRQGTPEGDAVQAVNELLASRGIEALPPADVRSLLEAGKWPPD